MIQELLKRDGRIVGLVIADDYTDLQSCDIPIYGTSRTADLLQHRGCHNPAGRPITIDDRYDTRSIYRNIHDRHIDITAYATDLDRAHDIYAFDSTYHAVIRLCRIVYREYRTYRMYRMIPCLVPGVTAQSAKKTVKDVATPKAGHLQSYVCVCVFLYAINRNRSTYGWMLLSSCVFLC